MTTSTAPVWQIIQALCLFGIWMMMQFAVADEIERRKEQRRMALEKPSGPKIKNQYRDRKGRIKR